MGKIQKDQNTQLSFLPLCYQPGPLVFHNQWKLIRPKKFRQGFPGAPLQQSGVKTSNKFPCFLPTWERAGPLHPARAGVGPGVRPESRLRRLTHPPLGDVYRERVEGPAFASGSLGVAVVCFGLFVSCCPQFAPAHKVIFSPLQFLCLLLLQMFVQVQALQQKSWAPGPSLSQIEKSFTTMVVVMMVESLSPVQFFGPSAPGPSVQGILQARILECVATSFSINYHNMK